MEEGRLLCKDERTGIAVTELLSHPPFQNPMQYDKFHMGNHLVRGWMALHKGFDNPASPQPLEYIILHNTRDGRRFKITLPKF